MGLGAILPMIAAVFVISFSGIQGAFHLGLPVLFLFAAQQVQLGLGLDLPMAVVANRVGRRSVLIVAGVVYAAITMLLWFAGIVPDQVVLYIAVIGLVGGSAALTSTGNALLCDYYPVALRPRVIFAQRSAVVFGLCLCPPLVAVLALGFGWEAPFLFLAATALVFLALATHLPAPTPLRDPQAPASNEPQGQPATLPEAARALFTTPSLRFVYYSLPFLTGTVFGLTFYLNSYYENVFHQDASQRAMLLALAEPGALIGLLLGLVFVPRRMSTDPGVALRTAGMLALWSWSWPWRPMSESRSRLRRSSTPQLSC
jgi:predicted MFS family arabinose efflux permease